MQAILVLSVLLLPGQDKAPVWQRQVIATDADFRGVCAVSADVAWVSGTKGTVGRTNDGGKTWHAGVVLGAERLDFRDVEAFSEKVAYVLSMGKGEDSRIYKTQDGGKSWHLQFKNADPDAFYDALAFWDERHGIALSDPVGGRFRLLTTEDAGATWKVIDNTNMPAALAGEGAFAASGTCLVTRGTDDVWFVTGGAKVARVFHSTNRGRTWTVVDSTVPAGKESAGLFSIGFNDKNQTVITGGDFREPMTLGPNAALLNAGLWTPAAFTPFRSGVAWAADRWIAVGTSGSHQSLNGLNWTPLDHENYNAVSITKTGAGWAAGPKGRIASLASRERQRPD